MSRLIDADRLLKRTKFYNLPNGNRAIDEIDILHAPTVQAIPLAKVKQAREEIEELATEQIQVYDEENHYISGVVEYVSLTEVRELLDKLIEESEE